MARLNIHEAMVCSSERKIHKLEVEEVDKEQHRVQRQRRHVKSIKMRKNLSTAALFMLLAVVLLTRNSAAFQPVQQKFTNVMPAYRSDSQATPQYCMSRLRFLEKSLQKSLSNLKYALKAHPSDGEDTSSNSERDKVEKRRFGKKEGRRYRSGGGRGFAPRGANSTTAVMDAPDEVAPPPSARELEMEKRITQLEHLVAKQTVDIRRLQDQCKKLTEVSEAFANVVELLRAAGLQTENLPSVSSEDTGDDEDEDTDIETYISSSDPGKANGVAQSQVTYEYFDDTEIFGEAPSSVTDAADAAGAAILAGLLGGKKRMLVDVRDSELSRDAETLVQFIELAILPVAAGLEGLRSNRNRVKIVFPTVSQLLEYRRTMALAAPEVVALSTLGFDPVEERDNIVVIIAPPPSDEEGLAAMNELLEPSDRKNYQPISQPVVVLNHHMVPLSGPAADFACMYHLRLLSVQYMSGERADEIFQPVEDAQKAEEEENFSTEQGYNVTSDARKAQNEALLEAAMKHAHEAGIHHGVTRAMVIRAYPKPWHVFVDVSPDTDADFVVADTFPEEPTMEEINRAIVECLEGSEREDELVAQQMQQALEMKTNMKSDKLDIEDTIRNQDETDGMNGGDQDAEEDDDDEFDDWYDLWNEDSV